MFVCFFLVALEALPNDTKALFRRCQGQEKLGRLEAAFRDARTLIHIEPKVQCMISDSLHTNYTNIRTVLELVILNYQEKWKM